jgi:hypothetical protein
VLLWVESAMLLLELAQVVLVEEVVVLTALNVEEVAQLVVEAVLLKVSVQIVAQQSLAACAESVLRHRRPPEQF